MKTKDFIKMLQEADPSGEAYVRLPGGGAPYFAEHKEGYWDGPYQYLEPLDPNKPRSYDNTRLVTSSLGSKVDIHIIDSTSIVWEEEGKMENIKPRFRFEFDNYAIKSQRSDREERMWKSIEDEARYAKTHTEASLIEWTQKTADNYFGGNFVVKQPVSKPIGYYHCMKAYGLNGQKDEVFCQGECWAVIASGKFYYEKEGEYYVWKYDPEKGQDWSIK